MKLSKEVIFQGTLMFDTFWGDVMQSVIGKLKISSAQSLVFTGCIAIYNLPHV